MGPKKKRMAYAGVVDEAYTYEQLVTYTASLSAEYAEPLKVKSLTPNNPNIVNTLNQPIWYEPEWRTSMQAREYTSRSPLTLTFERPKWADGYDPPYPTEALILTEIIAYARMPQTPWRYGPPTALENTIDLAYWPPASGTYGYKANLFDFPEEPRPPDDPWEGSSPPFLRLLRLRPPADSGVVVRPFFLFPIPIFRDDLRWGRELLDFPQHTEPVHITQDIDRLTLKILLPPRTIALRAYAMPNYRIFPDLAPYHEWVYPGDTNEPVAPADTFASHPWLVDPEKYQPGSSEPETAATDAATEAAVKEET